RIAKRPVKPGQHLARKDGKRFVGPVFLPQLIGVGNCPGLDDNGRQAVMRLAFISVLGMMRVGLPDRLDGHEDRPVPCRAGWREAPIDPVDDVIMHLACMTRPAMIGLESRADRMSDCRSGNRRMRSLKPL